MQKIIVKYLFCQRHNEACARQDVAFLGTEFLKLDG